MIYARVLLILIACTAVAAQTPSQLDKLRADGYEALYYRLVAEHEADAAKGGELGREEYALSGLCPSR